MRRLLAALALSLLLCSSVHAACPGATSTVCASGCNYTSAATWESECQADLTGGTGTRTLEFHGSGGANQVTINGWTTNATNKIVLTVPTDHRHAGTYDTNKAYLDTSSASNIGIAILEDYTEVYGLQVKNTYVDGAAASPITVPSAITATNNKIVVDSCLLIADSSNNSAQAITTSDVDARLYAVNNFLVAKTSNSTSSAICITMTAVSASTRLYAYSNTCYYDDLDGGALTSGIYMQGAATGILRNNLFYSVDGTANSTLLNEKVNDIDYNASNVAETWMAGAHDHPSHTFSFVNVTGGTNLHLDAADTGAKGLGVDLSADGTYAFNADIDGETRSAPWDIGADELPAPAGQPFRKRTGGIPFMGTKGVW
jgi:hypothetical protein